MERLLTKYAKEIVEFEEKLRKKYKSNISLNIKSTATSLGEILEVTASQGDSMQIWEAEEEPIEYNFLPIENKSIFKVEITHFFNGFDRYKLDIVKTDEGYRYLNNKIFSHKVFPTLSDLTEHFAKSENYMSIGNEYHGEMEITDTVYKKI